MLSACTKVHDSADWSTSPSSWSQVTWLMTRLLLDSSPELTTCCVTDATKNQRHTFNETCYTSEIWLRDCHSSSSSLCEYSAIYDEHNFFLPLRQIIAVIHQNLTTVEFHRLPSDWEGRAAEMEAQSQRHESCQNKNRAANAPQRGKTNWKSGEKEAHFHHPSPNNAWKLLVWAANDMHRLGWGVVRGGGVGRCSSTTTCHISQPRQLHNRERLLL